MIVDWELLAYKGGQSVTAEKYLISFLKASLCPLPLVLLLGTTERSLAPSS